MSALISRDLALGSVAYYNIRNSIDTATSDIDQYVLCDVLHSPDLVQKNPFGKPQAEVDFACVYNL